MTSIAARQYPVVSKITILTDPQPAARRPADESVWRIEAGAEDRAFHVAFPGAEALCDLLASPAP